MREYGKIHSSFWTSQTIRAMSEDGRTLASYILTSPHSNMLGCFRIPAAYVADDLNWDSKRVSKGFEELFRNGFATVDEGSKWMVIHKFLKWNPMENPNVGKAAAKLFDQIPDECPAKLLLAGFLREYGTHFPEDKLNRFETLSKGFPKGVRNPEPEPEPEPEREPSQTPLSLSIVEAPAEKVDPVKTIFEFWQKRMNSPRSALDANRRGLIERALKNYTPADVCKAISGCSKSPHHMGQNDRSTVYNGLDLILRNAEKIDAFIRMDSAPPAATAGQPLTQQDRIRLQNEAHMREFLGQEAPDDARTIDMEH